MLHTIPGHDVIDRTRFPLVGMNVHVKMLLWSLLVCSYWCFAVGDGVTDVSLDAWDKTIKDNAYVLVMFYEPDCSLCDEAKTVLDNLPEPDMFPGDLKKVKCGEITLARKYQAMALPSFVLFRVGDPIVYDGQTTVDDISHWLTTAHQVATRVLNDDSFEHLTQAATGATTGDWFVLYYKSSCAGCLEALSVLEIFGVRMRGKMNVGKIDMETSPKLVDRMKIIKCPSAIFYRQGKMYRYEVEKYDSQSMQSFVQGWFKNMKAENVPVEPTTFDRFTDGIVLALKKQLQGPNRKSFLALAGGVGIVLVVVVVIALLKSRSGAKHKEP